MRIVVTGSRGQVGQVTVGGLIDAGHNVVMLDRVPSTVHRTGAESVLAGADDYTALLEACAGAEAIVHLAGIPKPEGYLPPTVHNNNVTASYNALCVAAVLGIPRVIMASSVNAIGLTWSRDPRFDYFPLDERHATRNEDAYSLSKLVGEQQADSVVRQYPAMSVVSLRLHMFMPDRAEASKWSSGAYEDAARRGLWGYTTHRMWVQACLGALTADISGHEVFFIVADRSVLELESTELARRHFPDVELRAALHGNDGLFDCSKAKTLLGWSGNDKSQRSESDSGHETVGDPFPRAPPALRARSRPQPSAGGLRLSRRSGASAVMARPGRMRQLWIGTYPVAGQGTPTGRGEGIWAVTLDTESGHLSNPHQVAITPAPSYLAHGIDGLLYAVNEETGGGLTAFLTRQESLERVGYASTGGEHPCHLLIRQRPSGALVGNYTSGSVALIPVGLGGVPLDEPGHLLALPGVWTRPGTAAVIACSLPARDLGPPAGVGDRPWSGLHPSPKGRPWHGCADRRWSGSGHAARLRTPPWVFSADRRLLHVLGELDGLLHTIAWNEVTSTGEAIDSTEAQPGESGRAHLAHILRTGTDLIVGSRGSGLLSVHHLGADGLPRFARTLPLPGSWPRHHAVVDGWLVVAQQESGGVAVLDPMGNVCGHAASPSPACILPYSADPERGAPR